MFALPFYLVRFIQKYRKDDTANDGYINLRILPSSDPQFTIFFLFFSKSLTELLVVKQKVVL